MRMAIRSWPTASSRCCGICLTIDRAGLKTGPYTTVNVPRSRLELPREPHGRAQQPSLSAVASQALKPQSGHQSGVIGELYSAFDADHRPHVVGNRTCRVREDDADGTRELEAHFFRDPVEGDTAEEDQIDVVAGGASHPCQGIERRVAPLDSGAGLERWKCQS